MPFLIRSWKSRHTEKEEKTIKLFETVQSILRHRSLNSFVLGRNPPPCDRYTFRVVLFCCFFSLDSFITGVQLESHQAAFTTKTHTQKENMDNNN